MTLKQSIVKKTKKTSARKEPKDIKLKAKSADVEATPESSLPQGKLADPDKRETHSIVKKSLYKRGEL